MNEDLQMTSKDITDLYEQYADMVYRICFMFLKNPADTEDAVQTVFIKAMDERVVFKNISHEKAWFIVTAQNHCKNLLKHWWKKNVAFDANLHDTQYNDEKDETLEQVMNLPEKFKLPIYLYYYEGYTTDEIALSLKLNASTLRSRLKKGRELLKVAIGGDHHGG